MYNTFTCTHALVHVLTCTLYGMIGISMFMYCIHRGVEIVSQLPDILACFHYSCPAPHILCIQFSFNLPDIHQNYQTMSCMTGCFHTPVYTCRLQVYMYLQLYNGIYTVLKYCQLQVHMYMYSIGYNSLR